MADEFVRKELFELNNRRVDHRFEMTEKLVSSAVERMEAVMEKNLAKYDAIASEMRAQNSEMRSQISEIKGDVKALSASFATLQSRFAWNLAWVGIIMGLVLAVVQRLWK